MLVASGSNFPQLGNWEIPLQASPIFPSHGPSLVCMSEKYWAHAQGCVYVCARGWGAVTGVSLCINIVAPIKSAEV